LKKQKIRNNILYMLERDDLTNRFGRFKGLGRVKTEFGTVDCPQVDQTGLAKEG